MADGTGSGSCCENACVMWRFLKMQADFDSLNNCNFLNNDWEFGVSYFLTARYRPNNIHILYEIS